MSTFSKRKAPVFGEDIVSTAGNSGLIRVERFSVQYLRTQSGLNLKMKKTNC
jgi:hypothetical protein